MTFYNDVLIVAIIRASLNLRHLKIGHNDISDVCDEIIEALVYTYYCFDLESSSFETKLESELFSFELEDKVTYNNDGFAILRLSGIKLTICLSGRFPCEKQDIKHVEYLLDMGARKFSNIPYTKVIQSITIYIYGKFKEIKAEIKRKLGESFDEIPLKICQIQHRNIIEKQIDLNNNFLLNLKQSTSISLYTSSENNYLYHVKDKDFYKGIAHNAVQLESALSNRKRKASEMKKENIMRGTESTEGNVERVLGHIAWLLEEAQKPDSALDVKKREIKRVKLGNLVMKKN
ncbi:hypothetical protein C1645_815681 [Glomus cerebriforme]|uniref:Uncharacterized protein n=1 Tax=Glomus cerebriforme TaxID=658196 RepID=A0A397TDJ2_9GLOM|nr:hypothetical protein C1645_815681 [Glomus cerebriforme]